MASIIAEWSGGFYMNHIVPLRTQAAPCFLKIQGYQENVYDVAQRALPTLKTIKL